MASRTTRIIFYTMVAIVAYFIMYALLFEGLSPNPDIQLVKIISGFTGVVVTLIVFKVIKWTRKKVKKGSEWAKEIGDKSREKLDSLKI